MVLREDAAVHQDEAVDPESQAACGVAREQFLCDRIADVMRDHFTGGYPELADQRLDHVRLVMDVPGALRRVSRPPVVEQVRYDEPEMFADRFADVGPVAAARGETVDQQHRVAAAVVAAGNVVAVPFERAAGLVPAIDVALIDGEHRQSSRVPRS